MKQSGRDLVSDNILIGFGSAGARLVHAALQTAALGLGPEQMTIGFVQQDPIDPELRQAVAFATLSQQLRDLLHGETTRHRVSPHCPLARTRIAFLTSPGHPAWRPASAAFEALFGDGGTAVGAARRDVLLNALFDIDEAGWRALQTRGFDRRASLPALSVAVGGADAATSAARGGGFWANLERSLARATAQTPARVVLVGAAYESLGASLLEFARALGQLAERLDVRPHVEISALLLAPHHPIDNAPGHETGDAAAADAGFLAASTFERLIGFIEQDPHLTEACVLGWRPLFDVHPLPGAGALLPASPPDLFGALAILRRFEAPFVGFDYEEARVFASTRATADAVAWRDIAQAWRDAEDDGAERDVAPLIQSLVFLMNWRGGFGAMIGQQAQRGMRREAWFRALCPNLEKVPQDELESYVGWIDAFAADALQWAEEIAAARPVEDACAFGLWRADVLAALAVRAGDPGQSGWREDDADSPDALIPADGDAPLRGRAPAALLDGLAAAAAPEDALGLGAAVEALFDAGCEPVAAEPARTIETSETL